MAWIEQYDYLDGEDLYSIYQKLSKSLGEFLIEFSLLEHALNISIAEMFMDDAHEIGYAVIAKLQMRDKIELFGSLAQNFEKWDVRDFKKSKLMFDQLKDINNFRNIIAHANWLSLKKKNKNFTVRTRIDLNLDGEALVNLKEREVSLFLMRKNINKIKKLTQTLEEKFQI